VWPSSRARPRRRATRSSCWYSIANGRSSRRRARSCSSNRSMTDTRLLRVGCSRIGDFAHVWRRSRSIRATSPRLPTGNGAASGVRRCHDPQHRSRLVRDGSRRHRDPLSMPGGASLAPCDGRRQRGVRSSHSHARGRPRRVTAFGCARARHDGSGGCASRARAPAHWCCERGPSAGRTGGRQSSRREHGSGCHRWAVGGQRVTRRGRRAVPSGDRRQEGQPSETRAVRPLGRSQTFRRRLGGDELSGGAGVPSTRGRLGSTGRFGGEKASVIDGESG